MDSCPRSRDDICQHITAAENRTRRKEFTAKSSVVPKRPRKVVGKNEKETKATFIQTAQHCHERKAVVLKAVKKTVTPKSL